MFYFFLVQKNAIFCTKELIVLYRRLHSFVQKTFYYSFIIAETNSIIFKTETIAAIV